MSFPTDWPPGCPADEVPDADGVVFRIAKADPVTASCMESHHESGKLPRADPCLRCGLSVFRELEDAINQQSLLPKLGKMIARGELLAEHGKACFTKGQQPTHTTWWPYEGVDRAARFAIVRELT